MYILMDMEWVENEQGKSCPTQLAAIRADENWNTLDWFSALICPEDVQPDWTEMGFQGHTPEEFLCAQPLDVVLTAFALWFQPGDVLCWWHCQAENLFRKLVRKWKIAMPSVEMLALDEYIFGFSGEQGGIRSLCRKHGIAVQLPEHCSENDVVTLQRFLRGIALQQEILRDEKKRVRIGDGKRRLLYDPVGKRLHKPGCELLPKDADIEVFSSFKHPIRRRLVPCSCCRTEYRQALKDRNRRTIEKTQWKYVFAEHSKVYHENDCPYVWTMFAFCGFSHQKTIRKYGLKPCKHCRPNPKKKKKKKKPRPAPPKPVSKRGLCKVERDAIDRVRQAKVERKAAKRSHTKEEKRKAMLLSQPGLAFWAGIGYKTFHLQGCPRLKKPSKLRGFRHYQNAIDAGYKPCRQCKPTAKYDVVYSIPITSRERRDESVDTLVQLCTQRNLPFAHDERYFTLETGVGRWRIDMHTLPVHLEHINLVRKPIATEYHVQPRLFLSLRDTFRYIVKHDKTLAKQREKKKRK